jgi:putative ABC transport system ATP-binding protein
MIHTDDLCKHFRRRGEETVRAVDGVSLSIPEGGFAILTGASGSGKTTLLSLLGGLTRPTSGRLTLAGRDLTTSSDAELARIRGQIGFVFQNFSLVPRLRVWENVTYPLIPRGVGSRERFVIARDLLARIGIPEKIDTRPEQLSGGEQQRVALARALCGEPKIVMADEPTSNLDPRAEEQLIALLLEIHRAGVTLILTTHRAELLDRATHLFHLDHGKLAT